MSLESRIVALVSAIGADIKALFADKVATSAVIDVAHGGTGTTTLTGIVKGNGTAAMTAAVAGTDYIDPSGLAAVATGVNTGDETTATIKTKLGITTLSGSNTGDQDLSGKQDVLVSGTNIRTVNGNTLLGSTDLVITGGLVATAIKTSAYTAVVNDLVRVDSTAGAFTVTLPSAPSDGDKVGLFDIADSCQTNAVLLAAAGGKTVEGDGTGLSVNVNGAYVYLIYNSTGANWKIAGTPNIAAVASVNGLTGVVTGIADLTSTQTLTNKTLTTPSVNGYTEGVVTANTSTAYTIDIAAASIQNLTLTGNCTYTFPTATAGKSFLLVQKQDATGSRTVTWPSSVRWAGGTTPTITATASKTDVISFMADGTYWLGFVGGLNFTRA